MPDEQSKLYALLEKVTAIETQTKFVSDNITSIDARLKKLEDKASNDIEQNLLLKGIKESLSRGNAKFEKIESRIERLERLEGDKAKETMKKVWQYILIAFLGAIISNLGTVVSWLAR